MRLVCTENLYQSPNPFRRNDTPSQVVVDTNVAGRFDPQCLGCILFNRLTHHVWISAAHPENRKPSSNNY